MTYDFKNLSSADFEDFARDLIGKEFGVRFEAFCAGPDGGIDGRHSPDSGGKIILQAKHYEGSPYSKLKGAMKRERTSIDTLAPARYVLATSCKFTPPSKADLATVIGPALISQSDIFGPEDLNGLLRKYPDILKAHIKLWLSGAGILDRVLHSASYAFAAITREDIEQKVRVYASNPSFDQALEKLDKQHVLIISGPPGVGKTTLAEMLCYVFLSEDWELIPIRSLEDGFAAIADNKNQIFLFDDFLGKVALDKQALAHKDSELSRFMNRIRKSPNARFILTTRGYIFEEARRVSEHLGDQRLDVAKYVLDVSIYTRRIKSRIIYNHLLVSGTPKPNIRALIDSNLLRSIVDHPNYNPRVIEVMTDIFHISEIEPEAYPESFMDALNNPEQIWDRAFRTHIDHRCRHLLLTMFFGSEFGTSIDDLRVAYHSLHEIMSSAYGMPFGPKDFEESLRILEGSFVNIHGKTATFVNPSLRDYLSSYLSDLDLLCRLAPTAKSVDWIHSLWRFVERIFSDDAQRQKVAQSCVSLTGMFERQLIWKQVSSNPISMEYNDAPNAIRIELLLDWWRITNDGRFADCIMRIAQNPKGGFSVWRDSTIFVKFLTRLPDRDYGLRFPYHNEFLALIEKSLVGLIWSANSDDLSNIYDAVEQAGVAISADVHKALEGAVRDEFSEIENRVQGEESESDLNDRIKILKKFAQRYSVPTNELNVAISAVEDKISEIQEESSPSSSPQFSSEPQNARKSDDFDDTALRNLFMPLLEE
jgi:hypothetical protein